MDNLKSPAYPVIDWKQINDGTIVYQSEGGFTKLEKAALMIAQGLLSGGNGANIIINGTAHSLTTAAIETAKSILELANK